MSHNPSSRHSANNAFDSQTLIEAESIVTTKKLYLCHGSPHNQT